MVFDHILWMFICLRLMGGDPPTPSPEDSLVQYAAALEIEYCQLRISAGTTACREAGELAAFSSECWDCRRQLHLCRQPYCHCCCRPAPP